MIDNRGGAVGLALNLCPNWINFYLATDVLTSKHTPQWVPIKQSSMNVTLGLGIPIGKAEPPHRGLRPRRRQTLTPPANKQIRLDEPGICF